MWYLKKELVKQSHMQYLANLNIMVRFVNIIKKLNSMKKTLLPFLFSLSAGVHAQITVTSGTFPVAGENWAAYTDHRSGVHSITPASPSAQNWNYVNAFVVDDTTYVNFLAASGTPYASSFPQSSVAITNSAQDYYMFFKGIASGFYTDGVYDDPGPLPLNAWDYNPDQLIVPTPFTYGNTRNNIARLEVIDQQGSFSIKITLTFVQSFIADSYGTISTPAVSNQPVIRVKSLSFSIDSTFIDSTGSGTFTYFSSNPPDDSTIVYMFLRNTTLPIVMVIEADGDTPMISEKARYIDVGPTGISENESSFRHIKPYPNPVSNGVLNFRFEHAGAALLKLTDLSGKTVYSTPVTGLGSLSVDLNHLVNGIYIYQIYKTDGSLYDTGKVVIAGAR